MHSLRHTIAICVLFACGGWALASVTVTKVLPDKLVYGFDAPATVTVTLMNTAKDTATARLNVTLLSELTREDALFDQTVTLAAGETKPISVSFRTGRQAASAEYGYEVRAVVSVAGQPDSVVREYFMVTDNPVKIGHLTIPTGMCDHRDRGSFNSAAEAVQRMRNSYFRSGGTLQQPTGDEGAGGRRAWHRRTDRHLRR